MPKIKTSAATPTRQSPRTKKARVEVESSSADSAASTDDDEVLDLTESSDDDIQELKDYAVVKKIKKGAKTAPVQNEQERLSMFMANAAADLKAKQEAKKRQEDIQNFLNRPSGADRQRMYYQQVQARALQARALQNQALQNQAYLNQMHAAMNNARPNQAIRPKPATTVVDLTGQTSPTGINSAKTAASGNGSSQSGTVTSESKPKKIEPDSRRSSSSSTSGNGVGVGKMILEFETGYKCTRCLKLYESKSDLKRHIVKVHTDMLNFKCPKCGEVFSKQEKLDKHEMTHGRDKSYVCIKCEMSFYSMETLKRHEKVHEEKKEYKCSECGRAYNDMDKLVLHERVHQKNELPFQCEECDEGFRARGNLKMHIKMVHNAKGKKRKR